MQRYRVVFTFEADDERTAAMLISQPDILRAESTMRVENISRRWTLRMAALASPLVLAVLWIGYQIAALVLRGD